MIRNWKITFALSALAVAAIILATHKTQAASADPADGIGTSQFRRLADPSERSAVGTVVLRNSGSLQIATTTLKGLNQQSLAIYFAPAPTPPFDAAGFDGYLLYDVSPISRMNFKKGNWFERLVGTNEAPPLIPFIADLGQAAGHGFVLGNVATSADIISFTNIIGNITNIVNGIPFPLPEKTNIVLATFWAPLPVISADPAKLSYHKHAKLLPPLVDPPAPHARATIQYKYDGTTGRSIFEVAATGMPGGQIPHLYIANTTDTNAYLLIDAGTLTLNKSGTVGTYIRDTQFGDPLPQQAANIGDLSGRIIQILDLNGNPPFIYVEGVIP